MKLFCLLAGKELTIKACKIKIRDRPRKEMIKYLWMKIKSIFEGGKNEHYQSDRGNWA